MRARTLLIAITAAGTALTPAFAQVAPPPPPPTTPEPEFVPPPMQPPRPAQPREFDTRRGGTPRVATGLPDIPHPGLWEFCGTQDPAIEPVCRFDVNLHYAALRPNPTISSGMAPKIQEVIVARRARFELVVIEHLDETLDVDRGLVESVSISDPTALAELLERVKPLTPPTNLTQELQARGVLTKTQADFNNKIIGDYQRAYGEYLRRTSPEDSTDRFMRSMFDDSMVEAIQAYEGMLHESRVNIDRILEKVRGIDAETRRSLLALKIDSLEDMPPDQIKDSAEEIKLAWRTLSMEQKQQYLRATRSIRADENRPIVPTINVMWAGKRVIEGEPPLIVDPKTNIQINQGPKEDD